MTKVVRLGHGNLEKNPTLKAELSQLEPSIISDEVDYTDYRFEAARLDSFNNWPNKHPMDPGKLAASGFYYSGKNDLVKCFECRISLSGWTKGDNAMVEHQRWSGRCRFVRNIPCGNVPIGVDPSTVPRSKRIDVCGLYGLKYKPYSTPDNNVDKISQVNDEMIKEKENGKCKLNHPKMYDNTKFKIFDDDLNTLDIVKFSDLKDSNHPEYASYGRRLRSFNSWPEKMKQKKEDMAAAGFFYTGCGDQTICFYCGGGLTDWAPTDEPIQEHVKWFSKCQFIIQIQAKEQEKQLEKDADRSASPGTQTEHEMTAQVKDL